MGSQIFEYIISNDIVKFKEFLKENPKDINITDRDGRSALINSVNENRLEMLKLLLKHGADVNLQDKFGFSALHFAAQNYQVDATKILLKNRATVDLEDENGNTPLSNAIFYSEGRGELIKILLAHGANKNKKNKHGVSPVDLANTIANFDVKKFL